MSRPRALVALPALILAGGLLLTGLAACSDTPAAPAGGPLPDGATLITQGAVAIAGMKSAHVRIETEGQVSSLPLKRAEGDLVNTGDAKGSLQLQQGETLIEYQFVVIGTTVHLKGATGGWQALPASVASTIYDPSAILDPNRGIAQLVRSAKNPTTEAAEQVDGKNAYRVKVDLDRAAVATLVPGVPDGVTGTLWLDAQTKHLLKGVLTVPGAAGGPGGSVTVNVSAIDVPVTVSAP
jgi:lipoprotein LprG